MTKNKLLGENIQRLRKRNGIKQEELATAIGVAGPTLSLYENGKSSPNHKVIQKIAQQLGVSVGALLGEQSREEESNVGEHPNISYSNALISMEEMIAFANAIKSAKAYYDQAPQKNQIVEEWVAASEQMLKKLEEQANLVRDLKAKLDYSKELLQYRTGR